MLTHVAHEVFIHFQRFSTFVTWKIFTKCALCKNVLRRLEYWRRTCLPYWGKRPPDSGKSQTNATNVTMPFIKQAIWRNIWKRTLKQNDSFLGQFKNNSVWSKALFLTNQRSGVLTNRKPPFRSRESMCLSPVWLQWCVFKLYFTQIAFHNKCTKETFFWQASLF